MSCPEAEVLEDLVRGDLEDDVAVEIRRHVEGCATCQQEVQELTALRLVLQTIAVSQAPSGLVAGMMGRVRAARRRERLRVGWILALGVSLYAAAQGLDPLWLPAYLSRVAFEMVWVASRLLSQLPLVQGISMAVLAAGVLLSGLLLRTLLDQS